MKLKKAYAQNEDNGAYGPDHEEYWFHCFGCEFPHRVIVKWGFLSGRTEPTWEFNGDTNEPTFNPSLLFRGVGVCHMFIHHGIIQYLPDCTHEFAGKSMVMKELKEVNTWDKE